MKVSSRHLKELLELVLSIGTSKEAEALLHDILTPQELKTIAERWQIVQALAAGKTQRQIAQELQVSISKVTRGSNTLQRGKGGFVRGLKKKSSKR